MEQYDAVKALWLQIDKIHLSYLQTEGNSHRFEQKRKLEGLMREYLSLVPPSQRFYFNATSELLYNSVLNKDKDFSASKFGLAWDALDSYASNLLNHPWRKEFQEIRLYSGGYKHQIESQLLCAEEILMLMGYTFNIELNQLTLNTLIDPDTVALVSRDCILAKVESQILGEIHAALMTRLGCSSFEDIVDYRKRYVGSVSHSVRGLIYQHHQRAAMSYYSTPATAAYHLDAPLTHRPIEVYPNYFGNAPCQYNQAPAYPDCYRNFGFVNPSYAKTMGEHNSNKNNAAETPSSTYSGFSFQRGPKMLPKFLEEIDFDTVERLCYEDVDKRESLNAFSDAKLPNTRTSTEGTSFGNPIATAASPFGQDQVAKNVSANTGARAKVPKGEGLVSKADRHPDVVISSKGNASSSEVHKYRTKRDSSSSEGTTNGWECVACTYMNKVSKEICDMCAKSRNRGAELEPLYKGGKECSKCTLVNPREDLYCRACASSLHEAPTYI